MPDGQATRKASARQNFFARVLAPQWVFAAFSLVFGLAAVVTNPPLRGPDEAAHFVRAYGIAGGEIVPSQVDVQDRRGLMLPATLHADLTYFEEIRHRVGTPGFRYRDVFVQWVASAPEREAERRAGGRRAEVLTLYTGSEGYTPAAYLPYIAAAIVARIANLEFLPMFYLMRLAGLIATTALVAYAIVLAPQLKWGFVAIALLPTATYSRAVLSADGAVLGFTLVITALCLRDADCYKGQRLIERAFWTTLAVLTKPPQIAFVLLEAMPLPLRDLARRWRAVALIVLPALLLLCGWVIAVSGDVGTWRIREGSGLPKEDFDPLRKLLLLAVDPMFFGRLLLTNLSHWSDLWRQVIGYFGWLDTALVSFVYPLLSVLVLATFVEALPYDQRTRLRIAAVAALTLLAYCMAVFLIFYLAWTPIDAEFIHGIQGRYFIVGLPLLALVIAALVPRGPSERKLAIIAQCAAIVSGAATIEALLRVNW